MEVVHVRNLHLYYHPATFVQECFSPCPTPAVLPLLHIGFGLEQLDGVDVGMSE
jgi:hypothetical protein